MKKIGYYLTIGMVLLLLCSCAKQEDSREASWIPEDEMTQKTEEVQSDTEPDDDTEGTTGNITVSAEKLFSYIENGDADALSEALWENLNSSGRYQYTQEDISSFNMLTYYVSDSEGDDANSGLRPEEPKKSLGAFSGMANITVLLKCGDTFPMESTFQLGTHVFLGCYGEGARPVLDYYRTLDVEWTAAEDAENVWCADLSGVEDICNNNTDITNCNIGQLLIDGECNFKRKGRENGEDLSYAQFLSENADDAWAIDWEKSMIYLYSTNNPKGKELRYAPPLYGISAGNVSNSILYGLEITGVGYHGISCSGVSNMVINGCYLHHIGGSYLMSAGVRYGNAIELWDNGQNLTVEDNLAAWIFDTCYTNQGSSQGIVQENVAFRHNIGMYAFWGIESWGDGSSTDGFKNICYEENIIAHICDITSPEIPVYANQEGKNIGKDGELYEEQIPYVTYRCGGYPFHQMAAINAAHSKTGNELDIVRNACLFTNRFLCLLNLPSNEAGTMHMEDNLFYSAVPSEEVCLFRYTGEDGTIRYEKEEPIEKNQYLTITEEAEGEAYGQVKQTVLQILSGFYSDTEASALYQAPKKVFVLGNSITLGFGTHGMASSTVETDYYYLLQQYLTGFCEDLQMKRIAGWGWEGGTSGEERLTFLEQNVLPELDEDTELVILQLGDNVNSKEKLQSFPEDCGKLLAWVKEKAPNARILWVFGRYNLDNAKAIKQACIDEGAQFVDVSIISTDKIYQSEIGSEYETEDGTMDSITDGGVASHPNDLGMQVIAEQIIEALQLE